MEIKIAYLLNYRRILLVFLLIVKWVFTDNDVKTCRSGESEVLIEGQQSGRFQHPGWPDSYQGDVRCLYRFIAPPGRKMLVEFSWFHIAGILPFCQRDFLDIYIDVASSQPRNVEDAAFLAYFQAAQRQMLTTTPFSALLYSSLTLSRSRLLGRYCGPLHVNLRLVSIHREIVLDFFSAPSKTDAFPGTEVFGFNGTFELIADDIYYPGKVASNLEIQTSTESFVGKKGEGEIEAPSPVCRFLIQPDMTKAVNGEVKGIFVSPTYPGIHPPGLACVYQLVGLPTQRIRVQIVDLSLPSEFDFCPTDYLQFFDGTDVNSKIGIGDRFCGEVHDMEVISTNSALLMLFVTGTSSANQTSTPGHQTASLRGFRVAYEFSDKFISLDQENKEKHIRGTECDFIVRSEESEGFLESPNYLSGLTIAPNHSCTFFFLGIHQQQRMESVRISFNVLELPEKGKGAARCNQGSLLVYGSRVQNDNSFRLHTLDKDDITEHLEDLMNEKSWKNMRKSSISQIPAYQTWCADGDNLDVLRNGRQFELSPIVSWRSVLILRLNAQGADWPGMQVRFRAYYKFTADYAIAGTMVEPGRCWFQYKSSDASEGWTNSPFFANTYPANANCIYIFVLEATETVRLAFTTFQTAEKVKQLGNRYHEPLPTCKEDYLKVIEVLDERLLNNTILLSSLEKRISDEDLMFDFDDLTRQRYLVLHYFCGSYVPGPIVPSTSAKAVILLFHSDDEGTGLGFQLKFNFMPKEYLLPAKHIKSNGCGRDLSNLESEGFLESPGYPDKYPKNLFCDWTITAQPHAIGIILHFMEFSLEGSFKDCRNAILRIYDGPSKRPSSSLCGTDSAVTAYVSKTKTLKLRMLTADNDANAKGFKLVWTELQPLSADKTCPGFLCQKTSHCIARQMECNGVPNCGTYTNYGHTVTDNSDETMNCPESTNYSYVHIGIGVLLTLLLVAGLVVLILCRERKRNRKLARDPLSCDSPPHVDTESKLINTSSPKSFYFGYRGNQNYINKNNGGHNPNSSSLHSIAATRSPENDLRHIKSVVDMNSCQQPPVHNFHHCQHFHSQATLQTPVPLQKAILQNGGNLKCSHHLRSHMRPPGGNISHSSTSVRGDEGAIVCPIHRGAVTIEGTPVAYPHVVHIHPMVHRRVAETTRGSNPARSLSLASGTLNSSLDESTITRERIQKNSIV